MKKNETDIYFPAEKFVMWLTAKRCMYFEEGDNILVFLFYAKIQHPFSCRGLFLTFHSINETVVLILMWTHLLKLMETGLRGLLMEFAVWPVVEGNNKELDLAPTPPPKMVEINVLVRRFHHEAVTLTGVQVSIQKSKHFLHYILKHKR